MDVHNRVVVCAHACVKSAGPSWKSFGATRTSARVSIVAGGGKLVALCCSYFESVDSQHSSRLWCVMLTDEIVKTSKLCSLIVLKEKFAQEPHK